MAKSSKKKTVRKRKAAKKFYRKIADYSEPEDFNFPCAPAVILPTVPLAVGMLKDVGGIQCVIKYVNAGKAWLTPVKDHGGLVARHVAYATITEYGVIEIL